MPITQIIKLLMSGLPLIIRTIDEKNENKNLKEEIKNLKKKIRFLTVLVWVLGIGFVGMVILLVVLKA
jgi:hypothetical protein